MVNMESKSPEKSGFWSFRSARFRLTLLMGFTLLGNTLMRTCMGIAMVCMVNSTMSDSNNKTGITGYNLTCTAPVSGQKSGYQGTFLWGSYEQGLIFSSLMFGVVLGSMPAGWMSDRYNSKWLVTMAMTALTLGTFLMPLAASYGGYIAVAILRFFIGLLGQAFVIPAMSAITARWTPPVERSSVVAIKSSGPQIATIIGIPLNAFLCTWTSFWDGWPLIFYFNALIGLLATVLWVIFGSNRPETCRSISETEKLYLVKSLEDQNLRRHKDAPKRIPWLKMLTSPALLTCFLSNFTIGVFFVVMMSYAPTYFKLVLGLNLKANGALNALPYICLLLATYLFGFTADILKKRTKLSPTFICKMFSFGGSLLAATCVIGFSFMDCHHAGFAVAFLCITYIMYAGILCSYLTSLASIAPCFAGMVHSMCRFIGFFGDTLAPFAVAAVTKSGTVQAWKNVFYLAAGLTCLSGLSYLIFGSATLQPWAQLSDAATEMKVVANVENNTKSDGDSGNNSETESSTFVVKNCFN